MHPWHAFTSWHGWVWAGWPGLVAIGTLTLAAVTFGLVLVTRRSVSSVADQIELERKQSEAAQWPRVFPMPLDKWVRSSDQYAGLLSSTVLPIKNGGTGLALNIHGQLDFTNQDGPIVEFVDTNLGAGDSIDIVIDWPGVRRDGSDEVKSWTNVRGHLSYAGLGGNEWKTSFHITTEGARGHRRVRVTETEMTKRAGVAVSVAVGLDPEQWYRPAGHRATA